MRNRLNKYLADVDNVIQEIPEQRQVYQNKSEGFLKIRKPNQAIILRAPDNGELEFQKNNSYLNDGFTITMWVRFVSKMKKPGTVLFLEKTNFFNDVVDLFGAEAFDVPLKMVAESATSPVPATSRKIR